MSRPPPEGHPNPSARLASVAHAHTGNLQAADRNHLWHPFTQQQSWGAEEPPLVIDRAEGTNLYDTEGNVYIDGVSSLWCNVHGHGHPVIDAAVRAQLGRVAHSTMLGLTHRPAIELAEKLTAVAPKASLACSIQRAAQPRSGGYLPLAATLTTERVYDGFLGAAEEFKTFFHGHTYTGNPLAAAAAIATLDTFETERTLESLQPKIGLLNRLLSQRIVALPGVAEIRQRGFLVGIELIEQPVADRVGHQVTLAARRRGAVIRPVGT